MKRNYELKSIEDKLSSQQNNWKVDIKKVVVEDT